jgi:Protein of unknown function (DUF3313)
MMTNRRYRSSVALCVVGGFLLAACLGWANAATSDVPATLEGLVKVPSKRLGAVYLLPGEDFRVYTKVMIDPVQVSFKKGWVKDINYSRGMSRKITDSDAQAIADAMRSGFQDIFASAFKTKGYEVVAAPGPDVLRLSTAIVNVYLNAPDPMGGPAPSRTITVEAGEATLVLNARDSTSGALLGVAYDRSTTRGVGRATITSSTSNRAEFEDLFRYWANVSVKGLEQLKAKSPLPASKAKS